MEALTERAGGNPLFVRELVFAAQHGEEFTTLPETVESLLTTRIDTLDPPDRMLLRYASVVGPRFPLDLLGEILADEIPDAGHPERWAYLGEFIVPADNDELAFRHDLVRATAYEGLSFRRRRDIHARSASPLERRLGTRADEEAALLSLHFHEAHQFERSWKLRRHRGRPGGCRLRQRRRLRALQARARGGRAPRADRKGRARGRGGVARRRL